MRHLIGVQTHQGDQRSACTVDRPHFSSLLQHTAHAFKASVNALTKAWGAPTAQRSRCRIWLAAALLMTLFASPRSAKAIEGSVQRRDYAFSTYFELSDEGAPSGTVVRQRWRQPLRSTYDLYDAQGEPSASATTRLFSLGLIFPWARTLDMLDARGETKYILRGVWFTVDAALFELEAATGETLASLRVDLKHSGCIATRPGTRHAILARLYRNQISDYNHERWDYSAVADSGIPPYVWQLTAAFLADIW